MRRENSSSGAGARVFQANDKLEEKKKRIAESSTVPTVKKVDDSTRFELENIQEAKKSISDEDEIPTGFLDDGIDEDETPTGFLDNGTSEDEIPTGFLDDEEPVKAASKVTVTKVSTSRKTSNSSSTGSTSRSTTGSRSQLSGANRGSRNSGSEGTSENGETSGSSMMNPIRPRRTRQSGPTEDDFKNEDDRLISEGIESSNPYVAEEIEKGNQKSRKSKQNYTRDDIDDVPVKKEKKEPPKKKEKGGSKILLVFGIIFGLFAVLVVGAFASRYLNSELSMPEVAEGATVDDVVAKIDSLYTDESKSDINVGVTDKDIQECVALLDSYKNSENVDNYYYSIYSQEVGTLSFYLQDRDLYNALLDGTAGLTDTVSTIQSDMSLYTVDSLKATMESNLRVLESLYGVSILDEDNSLDGSVSGSGDLSKDYSGGDSDEGLEGGSDYTDTTITGIEDNSSGSEDYASGDEADISGSGDQPSVTVEGSVGGSTDSEEVAKILNLFSDSDE